MSSKPIYTDQSYLWFNFETVLCIDGRKFECIAAFLRSFLDESILHHTGRGRGISKRCIVTGLCGLVLISALILASSFFLRCRYLLINLVDLLLCMGFIVLLQSAPFHKELLLVHMVTKGGLRRS